MPYIPFNQTTGLTTWLTIYFEQREKCLCTYSHLEMSSSKMRLIFMQDRIGTLLLIVFSSNKQVVMHMFSQLTQPLSQHCFYSYFIAILVVLTPHAAHCSCKCVFLIKMQSWNWIQYIQNLQLQWIDFAYKIVHIKQSCYFKWIWPLQNSDTEGLSSQERMCVKTDGKWRPARLECFQRAKSQPAD